jgi:hypothetical protein
MARTVFSHMWYHECEHAWQDESHAPQVLHVQPRTRRDAEAVRRIVATGRLVELTLLGTHMQSRELVNTLRQSPLLRRLFASQEATARYEPWSFAFLAADTDGPVSRSLESLEMDKGVVGLEFLICKIPSLRHLRMTDVVEGAVLPLPAHVCAQLESFACLEDPTNASNHLASFCARTSPDRFHSLRASVSPTFLQWERTPRSMPRGLRELALTGAVLDNNALAELLATCTRLESLDVSCASELRLERLPARARSDLMRRLALRRLQLCPENMSHVASRFPGLVCLNIAQGGLAGRPADLAPLAALGRLQQLCVAGIERAHASAVSALLASAPQLRIVLHSPFGPAAPAVAQWRREHPRVAFVPSHSKQFVDAHETGECAAAAPATAVFRAGERVAIGENLVRASPVLREMAGEEISLPSMDAAQLEILEALVASPLFRIPRPRPRVPLESVLSAHAWARIRDCDLRSITHLLFAADYIQLDPVFDILCVRIAEMMTGSQSKLDDWDEEEGSDGVVVCKCDPEHGPDPDCTCGHTASLPDLPAASHHVQGADDRGD